MEIVAKRKHSEEFQVPQKRSTAQVEIPKEIMKEVRDMEKSLTQKMQYGDIKPETHTILIEHRLTPAAIRLELAAALERGNTPSQLHGVLAFLLTHQRAVLRGEKPLPLNSVYRKVPFS